MIHPSLFIKFNFFIAFSPVIVSLAHEGLHYIAFVTLTTVPREKIFLTRTSLFTTPYFTTSNQIIKRDYIKVLICPTLLLLIALTFLIIFSPNVLYSIVFATGISIGTGDLFLVKHLITNSEITYTRPTENQFGVYIQNNN